MDHEPTQPGSGGVTGRAVLIGLALLVLLAPAIYYVEVVSLAGAPEGVPARIPVSILFLLTLLLGLPMFRGLGLSRKELLVVYILVLIGAPLGHRAGIFYLLFKVPNYYYMARAFPEWENSFVGLIPSWWSPTSPSAINGLFQGQATVPWGEWWLPLVLWWSIMVAFWVATVSMLILIQRQWISHERLTFPVAQIPLDMIHQPQGSSVGRVATGGLFWVGFAAALVIVFPNYLKGYIPSVPAIPMYAMLLENPQGILDGVERFLWYIPPAAVGLFYLVPKEITFSCWFFWVMRQLVTIGFNAAGVTAQAGPAQQALIPREYQGVGAAFGLFLFILWIGRRHILGVLSTIFRRNHRHYAGDSLRLYRFALVALISSVAWLLAFFHLSGSRLSVSILFFGLAFAYYIMWARLRAETGLGNITYPQEVYAILTEPFGSAWVRPREIIAIYTMRWATWLTADSTLTAITGHTLESFKIADSARISLPKITWAMVGAFLISLVIGSFVMLYGIYGRGYFDTGAGAANYWPSLYMRQDGAMIHQLFSDPRPPSYNSVLAMGLGAVLAVSLGLLRLQFWWWPLHPMGLVASYGADMGWNLFTWIVAWVCKATVIRFGGLLLYRRTIPIAIGFIVGDLLNGTLWMVVSLIARS